MERFYLLAPALLLTGAFTIGLVIFTTLTVLGKSPELAGAKHNQLFGPFFGRFLVWMMLPLERLLIGRVSANAITAFSLFLCAVTGVAAATGHLVVALWTYAFAGILDALDGRIARLNGEQTQAGALFDSVSDRWSELFMFTGYLWYLHDSPWMLAVMAACGGSMMVSYTRARAEGLGVELRGGMMQRAERIVLITGGALVAAWCAIGPDTAHLAGPAIGVTMLVCGVTSGATAITRWVSAYRVLANQARQAKRAASEPESQVSSDDSATAKLPFVPQKLRESAELGI
ncbi:MAG TPA: CDP-alcohol phosphatidyltransferase family protein [Kofleriaceae bacterium]|nr:CDP-alcohol phosphatidyltransferase family protein [Kofleriaceae bacterium]